MEKSEYEIQHFGFSAKQVSLERRHIINKFLSSALDVMLEKLTTTTTPETKQLLVQQKDVVSEKMHEALAPELEKLAAIDEKYFSIPKHVLLPQYFEHANEISPEEERELDEEIAKLKHKFLENSVMIKSLQLENEQYESIQQFIDDERKVQERVRASFGDLNDMENLVAATKSMSTS